MRGGWDCTNKGKGERKAESAAGSPSVATTELALIQTCVARSSSRVSFGSKGKQRMADGEGDAEGSDLGKGPRVVSIDWVGHCLGLGEWIEPNSSDMFSMPVDPIKRPAVFKAAQEDGGERYSRHDVVFYAVTSSAARDQHGKTTSRPRSAAPSYYRANIALISFVSCLLLLFLSMKLA